MKITTSTAFFITTTERIVSRRTWITTLFTAILLGSAVHAKSQSPDPATRLQELEKATSLRREGIAPWHLKLSFTLNDMNGKQQDTGVVEVSWQGPARQKTTVESGLIHSSLEDAFDSSNLKAAREAVLIGDLIEETVSPVANLPKSDLDVKEEKRNFGKTTLTCLTISKTAPGLIGNFPFPTYCFEPDHPDILRVRLNGPQGSIRNRAATFQNTHITIDNAIDYGGVTAIAGKVEALATVAPEPESPKPDSPKPDANPTSPQAVMGGVIAGRKIAGDSPVYPQMARAQHVGGSVLLRGLIDKSGHIQRLVPIASRSDLLTAAAMDAVKTWTYVPYQLNGQPTEVDTTITVNFNLN